MQEEIGLFCTCSSKSSLFAPIGQTSRWESRWDLEPKALPPLSCSLNKPVLCRCMHAQQLSHVLPFASLWTVACQAPLFVGFSQQEYWRGLPFPPPGESSQLRDRTHVSCVSYIADRFFTAEPSGGPVACCFCYLNSKTPTFSTPIPTQFPITPRELPIFPCIYRTLSGHFLLKTQLRKKWDESYFSVTVVWNISPLLFINFLKKKKKLEN